MKQISFILILSITYISSLLAQDTDTTENERFSIHSQMTVVNQTKPAFSAPYSGPNSLQTQKENQTSMTSTLYLGARLWKGGSIFLNPEIAGGSGLSGALGIAAATNGETFRIGNPAPVIYLARVYYKQVFSLTDKTVYLASDFNQLGGKIPEKYFAFTVGKISIADFFDFNKYCHDPRTHFMSWALMSNGAWDYPANTRGYTPSVVLEYVGPKNEIRTALSLLPITANGNDMNWNIAEANSTTIEYTHKHSINNNKGAIRVLGFYSTTNMGNYKQSIALSPVNPDITSTQKFGNNKYGLMLNIEQDLNNTLGFFMRAGWNDGNNETWAFTEIDRSLTAGININGLKWKRKNDNIGFALVASGLSKPHRDYLKAGGKGFMLGDGNLNYTTEKLMELFYQTELVEEHIYLTGAYQLVLDPGYNADRKGPVNVFSVRVHVRI